MAELGELVERNTEFLLDRGAKLLVVACNSVRVLAAGVEGCSRTDMTRRARPQYCLAHQREEVVHHNE